MKRPLLALTLAGACAFAAATEVPHGSEFDSRIQYVNYNAGDVVEVYAVIGYATRLVFAPGETIRDVASGFTQGWEFSDRRNILYIKAKSIKGDNNEPSTSPMPGKWDTNLMVTTNVRMYDIDLHLLPLNGRSKAGTARISYRVEFRYPAEDAALAKAAADKALVKDKLDAKPQPRNWNYSMQVGDDSEDIAPTAAYDDGRFTYLRFPNNRDLPAAFVVSPDKSESLVNSHIAPDDPGLLVLHRVSHQVVLRLGRSVVAVYDDSYDADGVPAKSGMTIPGVKRVLKSAEGEK